MLLAGATKHFPLLFAFLAISLAEYTDIQQFPGYDLLRSCAKCSLGCQGEGLQGALGIAMGCSNWNCICANFDAAVTSASVLVAEVCSRTADATSATSLLNAFCYQLSDVASSTAVLGPTPTDGGTNGLAATAIKVGVNNVATSTGFPNSDRAYCNRDIRLVR
jgi:hypothetical protein